MLELTRSTLRRATQVRLPQAAAMLTLTTALSIVPLLAVAFALFRRLPVFRPLEVAIENGAEVIICMGFANRPHRRIDSPLRLVTQLMKISGTLLYRAELAYHSRNPNVEVIAIELELDSKLGMRDTEEIPRLIELGEQIANDRMPLIRQTLDEFHTARNRWKRRLRPHVRKLLRTSAAGLPEYSFEVRPK